MTASYYQDWRGSNDRVKYPFDESSLMQNDDGVIVPDDLFIDARLYPLGGGPRQYMSQIVKAGSILSFYIANSDGTVLASGSYNGSSPPTRYTITLSDTLGRTAGVLVTESSRISPLLGWADGMYEFTVGQTEFAAGVAVPMPTHGVRSLRVDDTEALSGHVYLVGGRGVVLTVSGSEIKVNIVGEPRFKQLLCADDGFTYPCPVKTINGLRPDAHGNFTIVPCGVDSTHNPIRVVPVEHGLRIEVAGGD